MKWIVLFCVVVFGYFTFKNIFPYLTNVDRLEEFLYEKNIKEKEEIQKLLTDYDIDKIRNFFRFVIFLVILGIIIIMCSAIRGAFMY